MRSVTGTAPSLCGPPAAAAGVPRSTARFDVAAHPAIAAAAAEEPAVERSARRVRFGRRTCGSSRIESPLPESVVSFETRTMLTGSRELTFPQERDTPARMIGRL